MKPNPDLKQAAVARIVVTVKESHGCRVHQPGDQFVFDCERGPPAPPARTPRPPGWHQAVVEASP